MAAKRTANIELNHDNWDDDMPTEEAGMFKCASEDELGRRVVKKAKRRCDGASSTLANKAFAGLQAGFCLPASSADSKPSFSFLGTQKRSDATPALKTNGNGPNNGSLNNNMNVINIDDEPAKKPQETATPGSSVSKPAAETHSQSQVRVESAAIKAALAKGEGRAEYYRQLRSLNEGVLDWIKQHVDKNAYCVLSPIFIDYDRHVRELDRKYRGTAAGDSTLSSTRSPRVFGTAARSVVSLVPSSPSLDSTTTTTTNTASISTVTTSSSQISWPTLSTVSSQPLAARALGSNDGNNVAPTKEEDEAYVPPKNEVQEVKEKDAFYSIRCKLFYKKDSSFAEKGVGTLYLKSTADDKTQLLIRAETNLGNILLNILLTTKLPTARMGTNNVRLVCVPNPPLDSKSASGGDTQVIEPVTFLVRVKTAEDADQLLQKLDEHKV